jgi:hypothetical protein
MGATENVAIFEVDEPFRVARVDTQSTVVVAQETRSLVEYLLLFLGKSFRAGIAGRGESDCESDQKGQARRQAESLKSGEEFYHPIHPRGVAPSKRDGFGNGADGWPVELGKR